MSSPSVAERTARRGDQDGGRGACSAPCSASASGCGTGSSPLVTWPEAILVAETLRERGEVVRFLPALSTAAESASYPGVEKDSYWERRIPCPFLVESECTVYAVRPLPCRLHTSWSPAELCAVRPAATILQFDYGRAMAELMGPILAELKLQGFRQAWEIAPLSVMVLGALTVLGADSLFDSGLGTHLLHAVARHITPGEWCRLYGAVQTEAS